MVAADETILLTKHSGKHCRRRKAFAHGVVVQSAKFEKGVYPGRAGVDVYNLQRSRITDQKRGTSDDLVIDHCSPAIERGTWQGMTIDSVTGLYYARNRNYDPSLGSVSRQEPKSRLSAGAAHREINQDPLQYINGADTYQFVENNPVNAVDPLGLAAGIAPAVTPSPMSTVGPLWEPGVPSAGGGGRWGAGVFAGLGH